MEQPEGEAWQERPAFKRPTNWATCGLSAIRPGFGFGFQARLGPIGSIRDTHSLDTSAWQVNACTLTLRFSRLGRKNAEIIEQIKADAKERYQQNVGRPRKGEEKSVETLPQIFGEKSRDLIGKRYNVSGLRPVCTRNATTLRRSNCCAA